MPKPNDISGQRFGRWAALKKIAGGRPQGSIWLCRCDCGIERAVRGAALTNGQSASCGCARLDDLTGQRFGKLLVQSRAGTNRFGATLWSCACDCGNETIVMGGSLRAGAPRSCGCLVRKHGMSRSSEYRLWLGVRRRCLNPNEPAYPRYGGRGIKICERWNDFANFYADMGPRPAGMELDRIDNNGPYSPENCRWATPTQQSNNRRSNRLIDHNGRALTIMQWSRETGIDRRTITYRLGNGWPVALALTTPAKR